MPSCYPAAMDPYQGPVQAYLRHLSASVAPDPRLRQQVLDLAEAPSLPLDLSAFAW